jgi:hypothetical protein
MLPARSFTATVTLGILVLGACVSQTVLESQTPAAASAPRPEPVVRDPRDLPRIDCGTVVKARVVSLTKRGWLTRAQDADLEILDVLWVGPHYDRPWESAWGRVGQFFDMVARGRRPIVGEHIYAPTTGRCWPWHEKWPESLWFDWKPLRPFTLAVGSEYWVAIKSLPSSDIPSVIAAAHPAQ